MEAQIPTADEVFQEEEKIILREGTYEFQLELVSGQLRNLGKNNPTVSLSFKALPDEKLLEELDSKGYNVKFDTYYDSTKTERYITKLRITNPKFSNKNTNFLESLEDQVKGLAFTSGGFSIPEGAEEFLKSFSSQHRK